MEIYVIYLQTSIVDRLPHLINVHMLCDQKRQVGQVLLELGRLESDLLRASKNQPGNILESGLLYPSAMITKKVDSNLLIHATDFHNYEDNLPISVM